MTDYRDQIRDYLRIEKEVIEKLDIDAINDAINAGKKAKRKWR